MLILLESASHDVVDDAVPPDHTRYETVWIAGFALTEVAVQILQPRSFPVIAEFWTLQEELGQEGKERR